MADGAKKAGGVFAAIIAGIGAVAAQGADDCARLGGGLARSADDVAIVGAGAADDVSRLGAAGAYGDDLSRGATGAGDDVVGAAYAGELAGDDLARLGAEVDDAASLTDDAIETAADVMLDVGSELVAWDDEPYELPVMRAGAPPAIERVQIIAFDVRPVSGALRTVASMEELDWALAEGRASALRVVVLPSEAAASRAGRSDAAVLLRAAQLGRRAILVVCDPAVPCVRSATRLAQSAMTGDPSGFLARLRVLRDSSSMRGDITLRRLDRARGDITIVSSRAD